jgi:hypothetical protein
VAREEDALSDMLRCGFHGVSDVLSAEPRHGQRHRQVVLDAVPSSRILVVTEMYPCSYVLRMWCGVRAHHASCRKLVA